VDPLKDPEFLARREQAKIAAMAEAGARFPDGSAEQRDAMVKAKYDALFAANFFQLIVHGES
jgi:hypothetical protein